MFWISYLALILVMSIISFAIYVSNYKREVFEKEQISEAAMFFSGICFGALGALLGMFIFHYKTKSKLYLITNFVSLILQIILFISIVTGFLV